MRLTRIRLAGFRAFPKPVTVDLDGRVVIIAGENGQGKTSILDGICWAITGSISRFEDDPHSLISMYSDTGEAHVVLDLVDRTGNEISITRSVDSEGQSLAVRVGETLHKGRNAAHELSQALLPGSNEQAGLHELMDLAMTRSVYLQQDLLRSFLEADTRRERFKAISDLVGTGSITDLQLALESSKKSWSESTNRKQEELAKLRPKIEGINSRLVSLGDAESIEAIKLENEWQAWWEEAIHLGIGSHSAPDLDSPEASSEIDTTIRSIDAERRTLDRRAESLSSTIAEIEEYEPVDPSAVAELDQQHSALLGALDQRRTELAEKQEALAQERHQLREKRDTHEELQTLAQIAIRHLDEKCPVCTQEFDEEVTREHLEELMQFEVTDPETTDLAKEIRDLQANIDEIVSKQEQIDNDLEAAKLRISRLNEMQETLASQVNELGKPLEPSEAETVSAAKIALDGARNASSRMVSLRETGEALAAQLARFSDLARKAELRNELDEIQATEARLAREIETREEVGELAGDIISKLRDASSEIVSDQLEQIRPLLQRMYSRLDPHPTLRVVQLLSTFHYGRGRLMAELTDPRMDHVATRAPEVVLSSSQLNAMAVAVFLSLNLGLPNTPLESAILDDPFQALDEVSLLGLVDLLRRVVDKRQLIVSTHDSRYSQLLQRKLRPTSEETNTKVVRLTGWSRHGPRVEQFEVPPDKKRFRIAA